MKQRFTLHRSAASAVVVLAASAGVAILAATPAFAAPTDNACYNSATTAIAPVTADFSATSPGSVAPGGTVTATNLGAAITMPGQVFVSGYNLGLLQDGGSVAGTIKAKIAASNTVEGQKDTNSVSASIGPIDISDPDGVRSTGDETAPPITFNVSFADMSFTAANSGTVTLREAAVPIANAGGGGGLSIDANLGFVVQFRCSPGTVDTATNTATWGVGAPISSTQIVVPPAAPVAADDSASVGANQAASINVVANDTDVNNDLAPGTVDIVSGPSAGTAVANPDGTVTYTNTAAAVSDSFTYTVADAGGLVSDPATVNISILGNTCDATSGGCGLDQIIEVQVNGAAMTMEQAGSLITLPPVTLNGQSLKTQGALNGLTVVNARGTDAGWTLTGQMTSDFSDGTGDGVCPVNDKTKWDNHCIPGGNVGWGPSAAVSHIQIPGDVATVNAGAPAIPGTTGAPGTWDGLATTHTLCSSPDTRSGGTFDCGGAIGLGIPASAAKGLYQATLTLTLV
ncbi:Ig-like domain-containing protein [Nocardioides piscis]|uniref:Tandem-95 repeat protein n=1 Tax=Nocardioides piscis TaxID=2714938 RepID=A0A6G7YE78_9ACTN|nr:Ig-like domain-containing protein [Nocardioides piscis]QIK75105.1 hypothetical protein G7071_06345 [Nocardioides piscis]